MIILNSNKDVISKFSELLQNDELYKKQFSELNLEKHNDEYCYNFKTNRISNSHNNTSTSFVVRTDETNPDKVKELFLKSISEATYAIINSDPTYSDVLVLGIINNEFPAEIMNYSILQNIVYEVSGNNYYVKQIQHLKSNNIFISKMNEILKKDSTDFNLLFNCYVIFGNSITRLHFNKTLKRVIESGSLMDVIQSSKGYRFRDLMSNKLKIIKEFLKSEYNNNYNFLDINLILGLIKEKIIDISILKEVIYDDIEEKNIDIFIKYIEENKLSFESIVFSELTLRKELVTLFNISFINGSESSFNFIVEYLHHNPNNILVKVDDEGSKLIEEFNSILDIAANINNTEPKKLFYNIEVD